MQTMKVSLGAKVQMASIAPQNWLSCQQELNAIREHEIMQYSKLINRGKKSQINVKRCISNLLTVYGKIGSGICKITTEKNSETVQVIIQYTNNKQVTNSNKFVVVVEFLHRLIFGDFRWFSPRKAFCEYWYN